MEAAVAALEAATEKTAGAASAAKEAAVAASAAATEAAGAATAAKEAAVAASAAAKEAAGAATAAKEAAVAALATAEKASAASSTAKEAAMAAQAAAKETAAAAAATAKELAAAMRHSEKRGFHQINDGGSRGGNRDDRGNLDLVIVSPTRSSAAASPSSAKESAAAAAATAEELAVAMRYSKKPRLHQIEDKWRGGGDRDDGGNLDFISALPDDVLGAIISRLPTKDGARTQAISRRWLPLWRSAPLNLVVDFQEGITSFYKDPERSIKYPKLIASVSKILSEHRGPARRLLFNLLCPTNIPGCNWEQKVDGWLRSQALDGLQEIDFTYVRGMPLSVFRFAPTLCFARFSLGSFPKSMSTLRLNFPCLKHLTLNMATISIMDIHSMLAGCTALESLELKPIGDKGVLCISSQTLRSFAFFRYHGQHALEVVIKDAPSLERLLPLFLDTCTGPVTIQVIRAPKLKILGLVSEGLSKIQFGTTIFQKMIAVSLTTKIHTMKVLVLDSIGPNLDVVVDFLKCFPCLVRLYVISHPTKDMNNARKYDLLDPIECLELHLKKVVLMNYDCNKRPSVDFVKFFVRNAKLLEEMKIEVLNSRNDKWMANHHKQLCAGASRDALVELKFGTKKSSIVKMVTHDFSMADPFDNGSFH